MKKTITTVVAAGIISSASVAQNVNTQKESMEAKKAKTDEGQIKLNHPGKAATKPGTVSGAKTTNPNIKPAREAEKKITK